MNWLAHFLIGGILVSLIALISGMLPTTLEGWATYFAIVFISTLAPDIDHEGSKISKLMIFALTIIVFYSLHPFLDKELPYLIIAYILISIIISIIYFTLKPTHRGIIHSIVASLVFALLIFFATKSQNYAIIGWIGYISHLLIDCLSSMDTHPIKLV